MGRAIPKHIATIEKLLRKREHLLLHDVDLHRQEQHHRRNMLDDGVGDDADAAVATVSADLRALETTRDVVELRAIEAALARLKDGSYGYCCACGDAIDHARLTANPTATRCIACQRHREHTHWEGAVHRL
jgi:DnaK suppressor protein